MGEIRVKRFQGWLPIPVKDKNNWQSHMGNTLLPSLSIGLLQARSMRFVIIVLLQSNYVSISLHVTTATEEFDLYIFLLDKRKVIKYFF